MAFQQKRSTRPEKMPGKTIAAVVILWITSALGLVVGSLNWIDYAEHGGDDPATTFFLLLILGANVVNIVLAIAVHLRQRWARSTLIVLGVIGALIALIAAGMGNLAYILSVGVNIAIVTLMASADSESWCDE